MNSLPERVRQLADGTHTSRQLVEDCLAAIEAPDGEGTRAFMQVNANTARAEADRWDTRRKNGQKIPPFAGIPMALKDLFDVEGDVTRAGSTVLRNAAPATKDAPCIHRLRNAGFIFMGRTTMVEFAFGGLGQNPHYGTPLSVYDRATGRVPGGSSSGSAVAVVDGMADIAMGTDTGGSCRIPAAFNGLTGYKPSTGRIPTTGVYPLSFTLDSVGPIGRTVDCCAAVDAILAEDWNGAPKPVEKSELKLGVLQNFVTNTLDEMVAKTYGDALSRLSAAGVKLIDVTIPAIDDIPAANAKGGFAPAEAWAHHRERLATQASEYDPRVSTRIQTGEKQSAADYIDALHARKRLIAEAHAVTRDYDAILMPSAAHIPPKLTDIETEADYIRLNMLTLRNTSVGNFLDRCSISLPANAPGEAPVGLMLVGEHGADQSLFNIAATLEKVLHTR